MTRLVNPFDVLGVSRVIVERELRNGTTGLERLKAYAASVYRQASRLYHEDRKDALVDREMFLALTAAVERLEDLEQVEFWANALGSPSLYATRIAAWTEREERRTRALTAALCAVLTCIDSTATLGCSETEALFALTNDFGPDASSSYWGTYAVRLGLGGGGELYHLPHPRMREGKIPEPFSMEFLPVWLPTAQTWEVQYMGGDGDLPGMYVHRHNYAPQGNVRIVGGVTCEDAFGLQGEQVAARQGMNLTVGTALELSDRLVWYTPATAWWMEALRPTVSIGDVAVGVRSNGQVALLGRLLVLRSLSP